MRKSYQLPLTSKSSNDDALCARGLVGRLCDRLPKLAAIAPGALFLAALAAAPTRASADVVIDAFERNAVSPWTFYNGSEFPGATGSLALGTGHSAKGAVLSFDLSRGGQYVSANLNLRTPVTAAAISMWLRSPPSIFVKLRVIDSSGQTLQYTLNRPFTAMADPSAWYQQVVALDGAGDWWGGANDGVVHNPIVGIAILAADPPEARPKDTVSFDDVTAVTSTAYTLNPSGTVIPGPRTTGDLLSNMGVAIHFTKDDAALNAASSAGFGWVRTDLFWSDIETRAGVYNWTKFDELVTALSNRGMHALFILGYGNTLYTRAWNSPPTTAAAIKAFGNYAEAAARHFAGKGVRFEVWNEANLTDSWSASQYAAASKEAIARVHRGDPNAKVSTTGVAGFDYPFIRGYLSQGGGTGADAVGVHPYDVNNPGGDLVDKSVLLRSILGQNNLSSASIWNTEWGFSSTDFSPGRNDGQNADARKRQAVLAVREMLSSFAVGFPLYIYYDLRDDGTNKGEREHNFGLLTTNNADKPAMTAVKTMARLTRGRTFSGFLPTIPTSLSAMRFDGSNNKVVVLWTTAPRSSVTVTIPSGATVTNMLGGTVSVQNQRLVVREVDGPVYVTSP